MECQRGHCDRGASWQFVTVFPESACEGFFVKKHLQNYVSSTSSHLHSQLHIYISAHLHVLTSTSLLIFIFTHLHLCSCSHLRIYISAHLHILTSTSHIFTSPLIYISHLHLSLFLTFSLKAGQCHRTAMKRNPLRRSCVSDARNAGENAICPGPEQPSAEIARVGCAKCRRECGRGQPSAEIARVECAKCRRECDLPRSRATLCGDRACRMREMQARVRFAPVAGNPLRRSCVSDARNAGESAICPGPVQPSAARKMRTGDFVVQL